MTERSRLGWCTQTVATSAGDSARTVAGNIATAFTAAQPTAPTPSSPSGCLNPQNARDVNRKGAALRFPIAFELVVLSNDPGISYAVDTE